ncbi:MAG: cob(I)yrinic acid a,c-diamide adenosyltransferase, partial [Deltaproteobacteria bacterium]|nr:cob(I)yrinic acid a,c-diamide adenosyltransferase [Deltaproteobacteria bacterium]
MVKINKVYTRTGDGGNTSLVGGRKVSKDDLRVECYGTIDELICVLGLARAGNSEHPSAVSEDLDEMLGHFQGRLFNLGAELATLPEDRRESAPAINESDVQNLETMIDKLNADLPPLDGFVLPGAAVVSAFLHQARAVCRRAERLVVSLERREREAG